MSTNESDTDEAKRKDEPLFLKLIQFNVALFFTCFALAIFIIRFIPIKVSHIVVSVVYTVAITVDVLIEFFDFKIKLKGIDYTFENIYLFKKYTSVCELASVVAIAFAIGLVTPFFSLYTDEVMKYVGFFISASLTYLSCATACAKWLLQYCYSGWIADNEKQGIKPSDNHSSSNKSSTSQP